MQRAVHMRAELGVVWCAAEFVGAVRDEVVGAEIIANFLMRTLAESRNRQYAKVLRLKGKWPGMYIL